MTSPHPDWVGCPPVCEEFQQQVAGRHDRGAVGGLPHPHRAVAAADDGRGAVREHPGRHRPDRAVVAGQRIPDRAIA